MEIKDIQRTFGLDIEYRMTCSVKDVRCFHKPSDRDTGFYWNRNLSPEFIQQQFENLDIQDDEPLDSIVFKLKKIDRIQGAEAIKVKLWVYYEGKSIGKHRLMAELEYFHDYVEDEDKVIFPKGKVVKTS